MTEARQRLVYLIQCHQSARFLADLLACLHRPADVYIINVDSKAPAGLRALAARLGSAIPNLHVLPAVPISWGGYSQAEIVLRAVDALPSLADDWSHLVVLSEQHLPLASPEEIAARLRPGQSLVPYSRFADMPPAGRRDVLHRFSMAFQELPGVGSFVRARSSLDESFHDRLCHSNNWFVLARAACERLRDRSQDGGVLREFESSIQPDEMLVPTLLVGYPGGHDLDIRRQNASFLAVPHLGGLPGMIFTEQNFETAVKEGYLFIRKRPDDLPQSVADYLDAHTGLNDPCHRDMREAAVRLDAEQPGQRYRDDVIDHFLAFAAGHQEIATSDLSRSGFRNIPALYIVFKSPSWHKDVRVALLSEDFRHFKIVLVWNDPFQKSFESKRVGFFDAVIIKVRVHGLALMREVFIEDEPDGGFLDIGQGTDFAAVDAAVARRFATAARFSEHLAQHERLETAPPPS
jgi:hypothetical protein